MKKQKQMFLFSCHLSSISFLLLHDLHRQSTVRIQTRFVMFQKMKYAIYFMVFHTTLIYLKKLYIF